MKIPLIRCALPCFTPSEEQTTCPLISRVIAVGLGGIALLVGILALSGIPQLHSLGTVEGAVLATVGGLVILVGLSLERVKEDEVNARAQQDNQDVIAFTSPIGNRHTALNIFDSGNQTYFRENTISKYKEGFKLTYPLEIFAVIFQNLDIREISVVMQVCKEWHCASKQNIIWSFYLKRDFNVCAQNCALEYKNQYLIQKFNKLIREYRYQTHLYNNENVLEAKWQALLVFASQYPEFKNKLPEKILSYPPSEKSSFVYEINRWANRFFPFLNREPTVYYSD